MLEVIQAIPIGNNNFYIRIEDIADDSTHCNAIRYG